MSYEDVIDDLADRVEQLAPQRRAAVFWLVGAGLRSGLSEAEELVRRGWFEDASRLSAEFIVYGRVGDEVEAVWERAGEPTGDAATQHLNSVIVCASSPLAIALDPEKSVGSWIEHALFPVIQKVSLDIFDDVAFPNDDDLEEVVADDRTQAAVAYCVSICERLDAEPQLDQSTLEELLDGSGVLNG